MELPDPAYIEWVVKSATTVPDGIAALITYCEESCPSTVWQEIRNLNLESDMPNLSRWLENVLSNEPPGAEIEAYWFGLFNPVRDGVESCDMYVAGSDHFDPDDKSPDWAVNPSYFPEGRYADSEVLAALHQLLASADDDAATFGDYALCLGYACLAVADICTAVNPATLLGPRASCLVGVGFDNGDFILLGALGRNGFHQPDRDRL